MCGLRLVLGLFLRLLLVIFEYRKTPRFDARQKIAVRSWLNRNGVLNLALFYFAPDKNQPLAKRSPPPHIAGACAFYASLQSLTEYPRCFRNQFSWYRLLSVTPIFW